MKYEIEIALIANDLCTVELVENLIKILYIRCLSGSSANCTVWQHQDGTNDQQALYDTLGLSVSHQRSCPVLWWSPAGRGTGFPTEMIA